MSDARAEALSALCSKLAEAITPRKRNSEPVTFINLLAQVSLPEQNHGGATPRARSARRARAPGIHLWASAGLRLSARQCACFDPLVDVYQLWASFALGWSCSLDTLWVLGFYFPLVWHALAHNLCNHLVALFPCSEAKVPSAAGPLGGG